MGLLGILVALGLLIWLAYRGWSILLARARRRRPRGRIGRRAAARPLDANLHGKRRALHHAILPDFSPRRPVRQADGGQRLGDGHRQLS